MNSLHANSDRVAFISINKKMQKKMGGINTSVNAPILNGYSYMYCAKKMRTGNNVVIAT